MNIQTKRTVIRNFHEKDADDLYEILGDEEVIALPIFFKSFFLEFLSKE